MRSLSWRKRPAQLNQQRDEIASCRRADRRQGVKQQQQAEAEILDIPIKSLQENTHTPVLHVDVGVQSWLWFRPL